MHAKGQGTQRRTKEVLATQTLFYEDILHDEVNYAKIQKEKLDRDIILSKKEGTSNLLNKIHLGPILTKRFKGDQHVCIA